MTPQNPLCLRHLNIIDMKLEGGLKCLRCLSSVEKKGFPKYSLDLLKTDRPKQTNYNPDKVGEVLMLTLCVKSKRVACGFNVRYSMLFK